MDFPPNVDDKNNASAPFTGTGLHNQRQKRNVAVSSMNVRPPVPAKGFGHPGRQGPMTDYRPSSYKPDFPPPNQNRIQFPAPIGGFRAPVNLNEGGAGGRKTIGTGVFIPTGRIIRHAASARNNKTYLANNDAPQPRIEKKNAGEDVDDVSPELCLPAEWIY